MRRKLKGIWLSLLLISAVPMIFPSGSHVISAYAATAEDETPYFEELLWSGKTTAKWKVEGKFKEYEVELYRDDERIATKTITKKSRDFSSHMKQKADYYFRVRGKYEDGSWSEWEESEVTEITDYYLANNKSNNKSSHNAGSSVIRGTNGPDFSVQSKTSSSITPGETSISISGEWIQDNGHYWYRNPDGTYPSNRWAVINDKLYHVNPDGWTSTGWIMTDGKFYYCGADGSVLTGKQVIGDVNYNFNDNGTLKKTFQFSEWPHDFLVTDLSGVEIGRWIRGNESEKRWFQHPDGSYTVNGWEKIADQWYYFDQDGWIKTGWILDKNNWFYCGEDGVMVYGRQKIDDKYYWFGPSGALCEGF